MKKFIKVLSLVCALVFISFNAHSLSTAEQSTSVPITTTIKDIWLHLDTVMGRKYCNYAETLRGQYYDCLRPSLSYATLQQALPFRIFLQGPHTRDTLRLMSQKSFGYYNPRFVDWLINNAVIGENNPVLRVSLQPLYQKYLRQHVRTYYLAYQYKQKYSEYYNQVQQNYLDFLPNASFDYNHQAMYILDQGFYAFGNYMSKQGYSEWESSFAGGFWIRRNIDKTDKLFFKLVQTLLNTYDKSFVNTYDKNFISKPVAPYVLNGTATSNSATISWNDNSNNEAGFYLYRWDGSNWVKIATLGANVTSYTDTGLTPFANYYYSVSAYNDIGESFYTVNNGWISVTTEVIATDIVTAPSVMNGTTTSNNATISWNDNSNNEIGFYLYRWDGSNWIAIATLGANVTSYTDTGLSPSSVYYYLVSAYNNTGESVYSGGGVSGLSVTTQAH